jgi:hypothetical protein
LQLLEIVHILPLTISVLLPESRASIISLAPGHNMPFFDKLKAKLTNKKTPKETKKEEEGGGEVHILPVPGVSNSDLRE